jgi:hypothetical protein
MNVIEYITIGIAAVTTVARVALFLPGLMKDEQTAA